MPRREGEGDGPCMGRREGRQEASRRAVAPSPLCPSPLRLPPSVPMPCRSLWLRAGVGGVQALHQRDVTRLGARVDQPARCGARRCGGRTPSPQSSHTAAAPPVSSLTRVEACSRREARRHRLRRSRRSLLAAAHRRRPGDAQGGGRRLRGVQPRCGRDAASLLPAATLGSAAALNGGCHMQHRHGSPRGGLGEP